MIAYLQNVIQEVSKDIKVVFPCLRATIRGAKLPVLGLCLDFIGEVA